MKTVDVFGIPEKCLFFCLMSGLSFEKAGLDLAGLVFRNFYLIRGRNRRNLIITVPDSPVLGELKMVCHISKSPST